MRQEEHASDDCRDLPPQGHRKRIERKRKKRTRSREIRVEEHNDEVCPIKSLCLD
jgi:hypothetical protein